MVKFPPLIRGHPKKSLPLSLNSGSAIVVIIFYSAGHVFLEVGEQVVEDRQDKEDQQGRGGEAAHGAEGQ